MTRPLALAAVLAASSIIPTVHAAPGATKATKAVKHGTKASAPSKVKGQARGTKAISGRAIVSPVERASKRALAKTLPRGTALTAAALLHYADGDGSGQTDARIKKALDAIPGGRAAAQRLANGIRTKSNKSRTAALGRHAGQLGKPTSVVGLRGSASAAVDKGFMASAQEFLFGVMHLLPENVTVPSNLDLHVAGVRSTKASDPDGTDELVVVAKVFDANLEEKHSVVLPSQGALSLAANQTSAQPHVVPIGPGGNLVVTAIAEVDGDANQVRADIEVAIELARTLAEDMGSGDSISDFRAALAYTDGMLALSKGAAAPSLHDALYYTNTLQSLWSTPASKHGEVEYKSVVEHDAGGGAYELLLDVPSVMPPRKTVRVDVVSIASEHTVREDEWMRVKVELHGRSVVRDLPLGQSNVEVDLRLARGMISDPINVRFSAWIVWADNFKKWGSGSNRKVCGTPGSLVDKYINGGWTYVGPCQEELTRLDINPKYDSSMLRLTYALDANELDNRGTMLTPKPGRGGIFELTGSGKHAATIELRVFQP